MIAFIRHAIKKQNRHGLYVDIVSRLISLLYYPAYLIKSLCWWRRETYFFKVITDHPVAKDSPDHLRPHGTKDNNITNYAFVLWATDLFNKTNRRKVYLDLGCSSGKLVINFWKLGWWALGLEGSDYSLKHKRKYWKEYGYSFLQTADVGKPFSIQIKATLITAWHVIEHLDKEQLLCLCDNIKANSMPGTIFIATSGNCLAVDPVTKIDYHKTQWTTEQWMNFFAQRLGSWRFIEAGPHWSKLPRPCSDEGGQAIIMERIL